VAPRLDDWPSEPEWTPLAYDLTNWARTMSQLQFEPHQLLVLPTDELEAEHQKAVLKSKIYYSRSLKNPNHLHLNVYVAERPSCCRHHVPDLNNLTRHIFHLHRIIECQLRARGHIEECAGPIDGVVAIDARLRVKHLPDPPCSINPTVVKEKCWIRWRHTNITSRVASQGVVRTCYALETSFCG
jgi:hypothetical protein